ncbi:MAG: ABC transporter permease [Chloroflexi bacterium]|nr:ABC transporter permease [Chloroflexota bacterium]
MALAVMATLSETRKGLLLQWSYKFNTLMMLGRLSLFFVLISLIIGGGALERERLSETLLGFIIWFYAAIAISNMSYSLTEESQAGTLEQMYMTPAPTGIVILGRAFASLATASSMIVLVVVGLTLALGIRIPIRWEGLPVFALTMMALFGLGFIIAGVTLLFKQVNQFGNLVENLLMYLSGALLPVHNLPELLETFSKILPTTHGIIALREVLLDGRSLGDVWSTGSLGWLLVTSGGYLIIGFALFKLFERQAKNRAMLGQY